MQQEKYTYEGPSQMAMSILFYTEYVVVLYI